MEPLAKPSGITLSDHRQHVLEEAQRLLGLRQDEVNGLPFLRKKYGELTGGGDLISRVCNAAWFHDEGKKHELWQNACRADYRLYQGWRAKRGLDPNAVDADEWNRYYRERRGHTGPNLIKAGLRHEIASLHLCRKNNLDLAERVAVGAHHGKLGARHQHRWLEIADGEFADLWGDFQRESFDAIRRFKRLGDHSSVLLSRYELAGVRALLRLADTRASRAEAGDALAPIEPFRYNNRHKKPRPVQELVLKHAEDWITILRAPTGSGKTDAAFLWAEHQIELGRADRLVVAMPTRFTSNALALSNAEVLSQTGLYHSSAWHAKYADREKGTVGYDMAKEEHKLARLLATPITVCTVDHLLIALTGSREDHHATFFFLANSAVVFDEVDFYDPFVQANLVVLLRTLRTLRVPILLMSATIPESARELYGVETEIRKTEESESGRRIVRWTKKRAVAEPDHAAEVLRQMLEAETGIVYANTVERAYRYWQWLKDRSEGVPIYLYHSRFTESDKKQIETMLVGDKELGIAGALGREAWENGIARGIAVLTQIGEMSINISAPLMLSDLCPWDRLAQRAGRLARFRDLIPQGTLYIAEPYRDGELYPAPYGSFEGPTVGWTAGTPLLETRTRIDVLTADGPFDLTAELLVQEVNDLYPESEEPDARARANVAALRRMIRDNWMIVPITDPREAEADVPAQWMSRDIPPQETVLISQPDDISEDGRSYRFGTYDDAQGFLLERSVECPRYLVERGRKRGVMSRFRYVVGNEKDEDAEFVWLYTEYDKPIEGQGAGLGALSLRDEEDSFARVGH